MAVFDPTDPRHLTPEQRLDELTAILAAGVRRLLAVRQTAVAPAESLPSRPLSESVQNQIDVSGESWPHVPRG
jgi:hypothetical protein